MRVQAVMGLPVPQLELIKTLVTISIRRISGSFNIGNQPSKIRRDTDRGIHEQKGYG
jgi:hypothetical protein